MIQLFCGYDPREAIGFHAFTASVLKYASRPIAIHALDSKGLPQGSNSFTISRFLVPHLMGRKGRAIFADASDMLLLADIVELDALFDQRFAVQVVKRPNYMSQHLRKYVGTEMECAQSNYSRKNWASLMLINCEHPAWRDVTPEMLAQSNPLDLLQLTLCRDAIGDLPAEWNVLADEGDVLDGAKLLHWTAGIPAFKNYADAPGAEHWYDQWNQVMVAA